MTAHIFADESKRNSFVLAATIIPTEQLTKMRQVVNSLRLPGQRRLHFVGERDSRRLQIIRAFVEAEACTTIYEASGIRDQKVARDAVITRLTSDALRQGAQMVVLELDDSLEAQDRWVIREQLKKADRQDALRYEHRRAYEECLLSIPDAVAWSWSKSSQWRKLVEPLVTEVIRL
ncbi:MAG TPA: hypothetical protein VN767_09245 [Streptosporangiaceae bacterium]|nr:hypothetical protein [Streptosporangiaceae bacterium]